MNKIIKENEKQKDNLFSSLKLCEIDSVKKSIFEEIAKMEENNKRLKEELLLEERQNVIITKPQVKFFLNEIKNGNINDIKYKKAIISVLIDKVFLYDESIIIVFNTQDKRFEGKIPDIKELESSFKGSNALPL